MRHLWAVLLLSGALYSAGVAALELEGVALEEQIQLTGVTLTLNGAGIRHKLAFMKRYVCALYLTQKNADAEAVYADAHAKRILIHSLTDDLAGSELVASINHGLAANLLPHEFALLERRVRDLNQILGGTKVLKKGAVIAIDYLPDTGTRVAVDGEIRLTVPGADFYRALLRVWIGAKPMDGRLRDAMLGGAPRKFF